MKGKNTVSEESPAPMCIFTVERVPNTSQPTRDPSGYSQFHLVGG